MRNKIIELFMNEPEEVSESQELSFYVWMGFPLIAALGFILILL